MAKASPPPFYTRPAYLEGSDGQHYGRLFPSPPASTRHRHRFLHFLLTSALILVLLACAGLGATLLVLAHYDQGLPSVADLAKLEPPQNSYLLSSNGTLLATLHEPGIQHIHVNFSQINPLLVDATIAVEDHNYYHDIGGIDLPRLFSSAFHDLRHPHSLQGASTIVEQLAKISFLTPQQTISRKIRELLLGYEITRFYTPKQILTMYLNRIDYGNEAIGTGTAAELYFHTTANKLDLAQASMLAGIPDAPTAYDPLNYLNTKGPNYAKERQQIVLQAMVRYHYITSTQALTAYHEKLTYYSYQDTTSLVAPNFVAYVESALQQQFGDAYLNPGGWTIYTSLNLTDQQQAEQVLQSPRVTSYLLSAFGATDAALVSLDPATGGILALVGTTNYNGPYGQLDMALQQRRTGSTFKIFTYSAALASGKFTMTTPLLDEPININGYSPHDYTGHFSGMCLLEYCLDESLNVPAVKVEDITGLNNVVTMAQRMGVSDLLQPSNTYGLGLTLGGLSKGITPLQMTVGASVLASGGILHQPTSILKIIAEHHVIYQYNVAHNSFRVLPSNVAFIMNAILSNNTYRAPEFGLYNPLTLSGRPVSAKTGTSDLQNADGSYSNGVEDGWTIGWTPQVVAGVWVGNPNAAPMKADASGVGGAGTMWHDYMASVLQNQPVVWYPKPPGIIQRGTGTFVQYYLPNTVQQAYQKISSCLPSYNYNWNGVC